MRGSISLAALASIGALALSGCAAKPGGEPKAAAPEPEHYLCSDFEVTRKDGVKIRKVKLQGQFGTVNAEVAIIEYLCPPAAKIHDSKETRPKDPKGPHLACYDFIGILPNTNVGKKVQINNQLKKNGLKGTVGKRKFLCVPSSKIEILKDKEPKFDRDKEIRKVEAALNHFLCSEFTADKDDFKRGKLNIDVADQFSGLPFDAPLLRPDFLCASVAKTFNKKEKKPKGGFTATHLVCYKLIEERGIGRPAKVLVVNQLDMVPQQGTPTKRFMFCVPSDKKVL